MTDDSKYPLLNCFPEWRPAGIFFKCTALALAVAASTVLAQESETEKKDEVFELSPFEVNAREDSGYYASQTLAGSRIRTDVRDVGASIEILTQEFLQDIGANDVNSAVLYSTNTESAGVFGNYSDSTERAGTSLSDEEVRIAPQQSVRIRGLARSTNTRNFFTTILPGDGYNTERIEINRGTSAILYGLGSPAGIANSNLAIAQFKDFGKVEVQLDSDGTERLTVDLNREIIDSKLAIRAALLRDNVEFRQEPAFENDHREYVAAQYRPWKGAALKGFHEWGERKANRPSLTSPGNTLGYYFNGIPGLDIRSPRDEARTRIEEIINQYGVTDYEGNPLTVPSDFNVLSYNNGIYDLGQRRDLSINNNTFFEVDDIDMDGAHTAIDDDLKLKLIRQIAIFPDRRNPFYNTRTGTDIRYLARFPNLNRTPALIFDYNDPLPGYSPFGTTGMETRIDSNGYQPQLAQAFPELNIPIMAPPPYLLDVGQDGRYAPRHAIMASAQPWRDEIPTIVPEGINNLKVFDFTENMLSGDQAFQNDDWTHQNLVFEQTLFSQKMGFEIAYDRQELERESFIPLRGSSGVFVDLTEDYKGVPNPNYGRPFIQGGTSLRRDTDLREDFRATAFVEFIPEEHFDGGWARWLGGHVLTGIYNTYDQEDSRTQLGEYLIEAPFGSAQSGGQPLAELERIRQLNDSSRQMNYLIYIGDQNLTELGSYDEVRLNPVNGQKLWQGGHTNTITLWEPAVDGDFYQVSSDYQILENSFETSTLKIDSKALAWNGYFLNDHLVTLFGWREDEWEKFTYRADESNEQGLPDHENMIQQFGTPRPEKVRLTSRSVVYHIPERFMPGSTRLSLHYADSESFDILLEPRRDFAGSAIPQPQGNNKEYGFTVSLADNKFIARFNWFEGELQNGNSRSRSYSRYINNGIMLLYESFIETEALSKLASVNGYSTIDEEIRATGMFTWYDDRGLDADGNPLGESYEINMPLYVQGMDLLAKMRDPNGPEYITPDTIAAAEINPPDGYGASDPQGIENLWDVQDLKAEGFEFNLTYNPTRQWRMQLNIAQQETRTERVMPLLDDLQAVWDPYILDVFGDQVRSQNYGTNVGSEPQFLVGDSPLVEDPDSVILLRQRLEDLVYEDQRVEKSLLGAVSPEQRQWRVNFVTNYSFNDGFLKGVSIGATYRWQDAVAIGYPKTVDENGRIFTDVTRPHMGPEQTNIDLYVGYRRKLFGGKVDWRIELRVINANTDAHDLIPVAAHDFDDYVVAMYRSGNPRVWRLTSRFTF